MTTTETETTAQPPLTERLEQAARASDNGPSTYIVLRLDNGVWTEQGLPVQARDAGQAKRAIVELRAEKGDEPGGEYVAIPLRSWQPTIIEVEKRTVLDIKGL